MSAPLAETVIVLAGGDPVDPALRDLLPADAMIIAADSGLHQADLLGLTVDLVVGDLDSVSAESLERTVAAGASVERHPAAKDETDLELALRAASVRGAQRLIAVGGAGGRLDHLMANLLLLASPDFAHIAIEGLIGSARVKPVHSITRIAGAPGDLVTLLAVGGPARGVRTAGLVYPLAGEDLFPGSTRGVSNVLSDTEASVAVSEGVLVTVQDVEGR